MLQHKYKTPHDKKDPCKIKQTMSKKEAQMVWLAQLDFPIKQFKVKIFTER